MRQRSGSGALSERGANAGNEFVRVREEHRATHTDDAPSRSLEGIVLGEVAVPGGEIDPVVVALVLDRDLEFGVGHVDASKELSVLVVDIVIEHRLG